MSRTAPMDLLPLFAPRSEAGPEVERKKAASVLDRMAEGNRAWLERMRNVLAAICDARVARWGKDDPRAYMTADDAQHLAKIRPDLALPAGASSNLFGVVFRAPGWVRSKHRDHQSGTTGSHGNPLYRWRYVGERRSGA